MIHTFYAIALASAAKQAPYLPWDIAQDAAHEAILDYLSQDGGMPEAVLATAAKRRAVDAARVALHPRNAHQQIPEDVSHNPSSDLALDLSDSLDRMTEPSRSALSALIIEGDYEKALACIPGSTTRRTKAETLLRWRHQLRRSLGDYRDQ